jgi:hypothetical protein
MKYPTNREILATIIYSKKRGFRIKQIMHEYRNLTGTLYLDGLESVPDFVDGLVEMGTLKKYFGTYTVIVGTPEYRSTLAAPALV